MNVVDLDVGYSNLKLAYGPAEGAMQPLFALPVLHLLIGSEAASMVVLKTIFCMWSRWPASHCRRLYSPC